MGEAVGVFGDLEGVGLVGGEARVGFEDFGGAGVFGFDPGHGAVAGDVFEPEVFVVFVRGLLRVDERSGDDGGEEKGGVAEGRLHVCASDSFVDTVSRWWWCARFG